MFEIIINHVYKFPFDLVARTHFAKVGTHGFGMCHCDVEFENGNIGN